MFEIKLTKKQIMRLIAVLQVIIAGVYYYIDRPNTDSISIIIYLIIGLLFLGISFSKRLTAGKTIKKADMTKNQKFEQKLELFALGLALFSIVINFSDWSSELFFIDCCLMQLLMSPMADRTTAK
ncbi:hypothetical protein OZY43_06185 [Lactobacillus sp. ESL0785]|uniref:hypothetical protein n=1 Tax=Lactobacillus sp. ESL0785 TaxID=2983232 RepID=UPI0023F9CDD6|nr:hypothetical protein [Lactobacillus sp. ESL0785]WEV70528.1 hypothetical protein OZY43_06185 [Lactobacillus sp. ESL0785]